MPRCPVQLALLTFWRNLTTTHPRPQSPPTPQRLLLACSAGGDSVALTHAAAHLHRHNVLPAELRVAHVHHHLRGPDADADAQAAATLADTLGLPFHLLHLDSDALRAASNLESAARDARYAALAGLCRPGDAVWTAHHADDQAETVLMQLLRGTAPPGPRGIRPTRHLTPSPPNPQQPPRTPSRGLPQAGPDPPPIPLHRPLLTVPRTALTAYLTRHRLPHRTDATNADTTRTRAALRHRVLPALLDTFPNLHRRLADHAADAADLAELLDTLAADVTFPLSRTAARRLPRPVFCTALRREALRLGVSSDRLHRRTLHAIHRAATDPAGHPRTFLLGQRIQAHITPAHISLTHTT